MRIFASEIRWRNGHVKHADSAQVTGIPLTHVTLHGRFERISEFTDNRDGPSGPRQVTFLVSIDRLFEGQQGEQDGEGCVQP